MLLLSLDQQQRAIQTAQSYPSRTEARQRHSHARQGERTEEDPRAAARPPVPQQEGRSAASSRSVSLRK